MAKKKGFIEKAAAKATKAVAKRARKAAASGAKAAVDRMRVKPQQIITEMRSAGWSPRDIEARTGLSPRSQSNILTGRSSGARHAEALRQARRSGGRQPPPASFAPVAAARGQEGAGKVRRAKGRTIITADANTDRAWLERQVKAGRGHVEVRYRPGTTKTGAPAAATKTRPPTPPAPHPAAGGGGRRPPTGPPKPPTPALPDPPPGWRPSDDPMSAQLWRAYAGRGGGKPPETPADAIRILEKAGATRAEIAQFKKDLAESLGVSVRQVQRMTTETGQERRSTARHKERLQRLVANHPKVRTASRSKRRASRMSNRGARLRIKGMQGPGGYGRGNYKRDRTVERYLDPDVMAEIRDAWESGDDARAEEILREALEDEGYVGWEWDSDANIDFLGEQRDR